MKKNKPEIPLSVARTSEILERDWRPWAYALLGMRAPQTWEIVVRPDEMLSLVPESIEDSYSWKMHQQYLVAVLSTEKTADDQGMWIVRPTMVGKRRGVIVRPSRAWTEDVWTYEDLRAEVAESFDHDASDWEEIADNSWALSRPEGRALALLLDLLSFHLSSCVDDEAAKEGRLRLVD